MNKALKPPSPYTGKPTDKDVRAYVAHLQFVLSMRGSPFCTVTDAMVAEAARAMFKTIQASFPEEEEQTNKEEEEDEDEDEDVDVDDE